MKVSKKKVLALVMQLGVFAFLLGLPLLLAYVGGAAVPADTILYITLWWFGPMMVAFMVNYYLLVPQLFYKHHRWWYVVANVLLIGLFNNSIFWFNAEYLPEMARPGYYSYAIVPIVLHIFTALGALGIRHLSRMHEVELQIQEQQQKNTAAELAWLKNQLNPHFLFNTLNNISSLTQIDADQAQESIAQLSDLLRYAMYETDKPLVPLAGEVEFMNNYIELMRLRCGANTQVEVQLRPAQGVMVPPLLFISLIENAFKHGVSSNLPSAIRIRLEVADGVLTFVCDNTNHPKDDKDRSGSGIGLENTRRRLQLLYPDRHEWQQTLNADIYHIQITIRL